MSVYHYDASHLAPEDARFFEEMVPYLSEHVTSSSRTGDAIDIEYDGIDESQIAEKAEHLTAMLETKLKRGSDCSPETTTIFDATDSKVANSEPIFDRLVGEGQIYAMSPGSYAISGLFLSVKRYFERSIDELADEVFAHSYVSYEMPDLIPIAEYSRGGYFDTFPHHIMFASTLRNDIDVIDRFAHEKGNDPSLFNEMKPPRAVLRTAACMPLYPLLQNATFTAGKPGRFVVAGHCFRNEEGNAKELERLNEFNMKELVVVGSPDQVTSFIEEGSKIWLRWQKLFGLNMSIATANDSFFASNYRKLKLFQLLGSSKVECRWLVPGSGSYIACSSTNVHRTHFTKTYNIRMADANSFCHSGCLAFGLERLSYALLSQLGLDASAWPATARTEIERLAGLLHD